MFVSVIALTLGVTAFFAAPEYDVVFVAVDSPDLVALNGAISAGVKVTDTHANYVPHLTLAYVESGRGHEFAGNGTMNGVEYAFNAVVHTDVNEVATKIQAIRGHVRVSAPKPAAATVVALLGAIYNGDEAVRPVAEVPDDLSSNIALFDTSSGWRLSVFIDGGDLDYIESFTSPEGAVFETFDEASCTCADYSCLTCRKIRAFPMASLKTAVLEAAPGECPSCTHALAFHTALSLDGLTICSRCQGSHQAHKTCVATFRATQLGSSVVAVAGQEAIDAMQVTANEDAAKMFATLVHKATEIVRSAPSLEAVPALLREKFADLDTTDLQRLTQRMLFAARMQGRVDMRRTPPKRAKTGK